MQVQHAHRAAAVAEHHQILAEDARTQRPLFHLAQIGNRLPETAQVFAPGVRLVVWVNSMSETPSIWVR